MLLCVNMTAHAFWERRWCLRYFPEGRRYPGVPEGFQVGSSGSPTACHEDFGDDGLSQSCSCLKTTSLLPDCKGFADSVASKGRSERSEDGRDRGECRECNQARRKMKKKQCSPPHHVEVIAHCSNVRLAKRREGLGVQKPGRSL